MMNKEVRIEGMGPYVERGNIWFNPGQGDQKLLIDQLLDFPNGEHDDGPDALEMAHKEVRVPAISGQQIRRGRRREMIKVMAGY